ncbi:MAG TPA: hypothetical protein VEC35_06560 [Noviherbaspirillum sp.]|nr:hypothetical protein [Noviherbaspirillum sp.]
MSFVVEPLTHVAKDMIDLETLGFAADYVLPENKWVVDRSVNVFLVTVSLTRHREEEWRKLLFSYKSRPVWIDVDSRSCGPLYWEIWDGLAEDEIASISALIRAAYCKLFEDTIPYTWQKVSVKAYRRKPFTDEDAAQLHSRWNEIREQLEQFSKKTNAAPNQVNRGNPQRLSRQY